MSQPYIYTLKAILDNNEIYDSADCSMIRENRGLFKGELPKYVTLEEYQKLEAKIEAAKQAAEVSIFEWQEARKYEVDKDTKGIQKAAIDDLKEIIALLIPRKEDSGTLEEHLANLRKQSPTKCQDCECLHAENHGPSHNGYVYECETAPKCYKENTTP